MQFQREEDVRELVKQFESCELGLHEFTHREHIAVATTFLLEAEPAAALERMRSGLLRFSAHYGKEHKYSEPITQQWMQELSEFVQAVDQRDLVGVVNRAVEKYGRPRIG
jgi:hypothetical protein